MPNPDADTYTAAADTIEMVMGCDDDTALFVLRHLTDDALMSVRAAAVILAGLAANVQQERLPLASAGVPG